MKLFSPLYRRAMVWSRHPRAPWYLGGMSFIESSFFPIPPDVMLAPMCLANPRQAWRLALLTTLTSVAGGLFGYAIGYFAIDAVLPWLQASRYWPAYQTAVEWFGRWGFWAIVLNRFIPGARILFLPAAGLLKMRPGKVAVSVTAANILFAGFLVGVGYSAGREFSELESLYHVYLTGLSTVMLFLAVGALLYWLAAKALLARRERLEARAAAEALP